MTLLPEVSSISSICQFIAAQLCIISTLYSKENCFVLQKALAGSKPMLRCRSLEDCPGMHSFCFLRQAEEVKIEDWYCNDIKCYCLRNAGYVYGYIVLLSVTSFKDSWLIISVIFSCVFANAYLIFALLFSCVYCPKDYKEFIAIGVYFLKRLSRTLNLPLNHSI